MPNGKQINVDGKIYVNDIDDGKWYELKEINIKNLPLEVKDKMIEELSKPNNPSVI